MHAVLIFAIPMLLQIVWVVVLNTAPATVREAARVFNGYWPQLLCAVPGCIFLIRRLWGRWAALAVLYLSLAMTTLYFVAIFTGAALSGE